MTEKCEWSGVGGKDRLYRSSCNECTKMIREIVKENTSGLPARLIWCQNKRKGVEDFQAAKEEQNWYSKLSVHSNLDFIFCVNSLLCNFSDNYKLFHKKLDLILNGSIGAQKINLFNGLKV